MEHTRKAWTQEEIQQLMGLAVKFMTWDYDEAVNVIAHHMGRPAASVNTKLNEIARTAK